MRIPKKYEERVELFEHDEDGWWIYLNYGWCWDCKGLHIIHEDTQKEALRCLRQTKLCDCEECKQNVYYMIDLRTRNRKLQECRSKRAFLAKQNQKEYQTRGNTQKCQELWAEIEKLDKNIKEIEEMQDGI